jgi:hypothetical protein
MNGFEMILPFLKPIEHLILDDSISEVMVNGSSHVFIEKNGFIEEIPGLSLGEKSLILTRRRLQPTSAMRNKPSSRCCSQKKRNQPKPCLGGPYFVYLFCAHAKMERFR